MARGEVGERIALDRYRLLGRSGLRVSPAALGTLTFGLDWGIGADKTECRRMFDAYVRAGGNFIDTSPVSNNGTSEALVGEFAEPLRQQLVIGTKFGFQSRGGDPNSSGANRKSLVQSVEGSLRRLRTDYVDVLWLQMYDARTPAEETLRALDDLVRGGKALYVGVCNSPAWWIASAVTLAELRGWAAFTAIQFPHSVADRLGERELFDMARALGLGVVTWSVLLGGVLTGKFRRDPASEDKISVEGITRRRELLGEGYIAQHLGVAERLSVLAEELGSTPAQVAIAWTLARPIRPLPVLGCRTLAQLEEDLGALSLELPREALEAIDALVPRPSMQPYTLLEHPRVAGMLTAGAWVERR